MCTTLTQEKLKILNYSTYYIKVLGNYREVLKFVKIMFWNSECENSVFRLGYFEPNVRAVVRAGTVDSSAHNCCAPLNGVKIETSQTRYNAMHVQVTNKIGISQLLWTSPLCIAFIIYFYSRSLLIFWLSADCT